MGQGMMGGYDVFYGYGWIYMALGTLLVVGIVLLVAWLARQAGLGDGNKESFSKQRHDMEGTL